MDSRICLQKKCPYPTIFRKLGDLSGYSTLKKLLEIFGEKGFNIYASGMHGTGRKSAVRKFLDELAKTKPRGNDWIYVNKFDNP